MSRLMFPVGCDAENLRDVLWNLSNLSPPQSPPPPELSSPPNPSSPSDDSVMLRSHAPSRLAAKKSGQDDSTIFRIPDTPEPRAIKSTQKTPTDLELKDCKVVLEQIAPDEICQPCAVVLTPISEGATYSASDDCDIQEPLVESTVSQELDRVVNDALLDQSEAPIKASSDSDDDIINHSQETPTTSRLQTTSLITSFYEYPTFIGDITRKASDSCESIGTPEKNETSPREDAILISSTSAPSRREIEASYAEFDIPDQRHVEAFCSRRDDVPTKGIELGLQKIKLQWNGDLPEFESGHKRLSEFRTDFLNRLGFSKQDSRVMEESLKGSSDDKVFLRSVAPAPSSKDVQEWLSAREILRKQANSSSEVDDDGVESMADFDDERGHLNQSQVVVRVRRDSGDSVGSEISCSPPSPSLFRREMEEKAEFSVIKPRDVTDLSGIGESTPLVASGGEKRKGESLREGALLKKRRISWADLETNDGTKEEAEDDEDDDPDLICSSQTSTPTQLGSSTSVLRKQLQRSQFRRKFATPEQTVGERFRDLAKVTPASPIEGPTMKNSQQRFKMDLENLQDAKASREFQYLTVMSMELHVNTRQKLNPDPEFDSIAAIFFLVTNDVPNESHMPKQEEVILILDPMSTGSSGNRKFLESSGVNGKNVRYFGTELEMIHAFVNSVDHHDPDICVGYEVQQSSWGYLLERSATIGLNLAPLLSRLPGNERESQMDAEKDLYGADHMSELKIAGRIILNIWRLMRSEVALYSYTFENMMYHTLHERVAKLQYSTLTSWWNHRTSHYRCRVLDYFLQRIHGNLRLLDQLDIIGRTSELARLFGIQFYEVLTRGSQFRVESLMLRLAKRRNYIPVSPNIQQRAQMKAPEYIPLVMEPESRFYCDPLLVLDFQSLYPSIIMAYNYCFSTCLGKVQNMGSPKPYEFGCTQLKVSPQRLAKLKDHLTFSPGGVAFLKSSVRKGVLPQMLKEILDTRLMVKRSMKLYKDDQTLQRVLHSRQLGLKLIANVTYGYTAANFSGRMPSVEVADSVVSKGRETLVRCIKLIENTAKWKAKVVYGDTDSVFVLLPGRTKEEAFKIGEEMAKTVTDDNPKPVKLKFEKVYYPCILQTKKRYVGYMYESRDQKEPVYDAKGIETVRRDGCPAVVKMLEKSLRILFETKDVSKVKLFVQRQFEKIIRNRASIQDLTFAKEFRGMSGYRPSAVVPAMELTKRAIKYDRRAIPRTGQRVPYLIVYGEPGRPLIQSVRSPDQVLSDATLRPNSAYYITKVIVPPLNRCFSLLGVDVLTWYNEVPKVYRPRLVMPDSDGPNKSKNRPGQGVILQYFASHHCAVCGSLSQNPICENCLTQPQKSVCNLTQKIREWDKCVNDMRTLCRACTGFQDLDDSGCLSLDCPVLYKKKTAMFDAQQIDYVQDLLEKISF